MSVQDWSHHLSKDWPFIKRQFWSSLVGISREHRRTRRLGESLTSQIKRVVKLTLADLGNFGQVVLSAFCREKSTSSLLQLPEDLSSSSTINFERRTSMISSDTQTQLQQLSEEWASAERQGDAAFFQRTLTEDFVGVGPLGFMLTKTDAVQRFTSGNLKYESFAWDDVKMRSYGDAAVMVGRQTQKAKHQDQVMEGQFRTTLIWVQQQGRWLLAGFHISPIAMGRP